jgi:hypothetical protein
MRVDVSIFMWRWNFAATVVMLQRLAPDPARAAGTSAAARAGRAASPKQQLLQDEARLREHANATQAAVQILRQQQVQVHVPLWMAWYDWDPANQIPLGANLVWGGLDQLAAAYMNYSVRGMLDITQGNGHPGPCDVYGEPYCGGARGLAVNWTGGVDVVAAAVKDLKHVVGVFLGDEPEVLGVSGEEMCQLTAYMKRALHAVGRRDMFVYYNDGPGSIQFRQKALCPGLDYFSIDHYAPTREAAGIEALYSTLHLMPQSANYTNGQGLFLVPGLFWSEAACSQNGRCLNPPLGPGKQALSCCTKTPPDSDVLIKLAEYQAYAQRTPSIVGWNPWHWLDRPSMTGPTQGIFARGAKTLGPELWQELRSIGGNISSANPSSPHQMYGCVANACVPSTAGKFWTKSECNVSCGRFTCVDYTCAKVSGSAGGGVSLLSCRASCLPRPAWSSAAAGWPAAGRHLHGTSQQVISGGAAPPLGSGDSTAMAWVAPQAGPGSSGGAVLPMIAFSFGANPAKDATNDCRALLLAAKQVTYYLRGQAYDSDNILPPTAVPRWGAAMRDGQWHHVAIADDGTNFVFYLDGRPIAAGNHSVDPRTASGFIVGGWSGGGSQFFGDLAGVLFFNASVLSTVGIREAMESTRPTQLPAWPGWQFGCVNNTCVPSNTSGTTKAMCQASPCCTDLSCLPVAAWSSAQSGWPPNGITLNGSQVSIYGSIDPPVGANASTSMGWVVPRKPREGPAAGTINMIPFSFGMDTRDDAVNDCRALLLLKDQASYLMRGQPWDVDNILPTYAVPAWRTAMQDGLWHHVAITDDGTDFALYLDGDELATGNHTWRDPPHKPETAGGFAVGGWSGAASVSPSRRQPCGTCFSGRLAGVRFYYERLSAGLVHAVMVATRPPQSAASSRAVEKTDDEGENVQD